MTEVQLGKAGLTERFIDDLRKRFEKVENVRISLLQGSGRNKDKTKAWADEITGALGAKYTAKIIGFTIVVKKWRKARK